MNVKDLGEPGLAGAGLDSTLGYWYFGKLVSLNIAIITYLPGGKGKPPVCCICEIIYAFVK